MVPRMMLLTFIKANNEGQISAYTPYLWTTVTSDLGETF